MSPVTVLLQQGLQLLSSFGPQGVIVGAIAAGALAIGKAFLGAGEDARSAAERAEESFKSAIDAIKESVGDGLPAVDKLIEQFNALPETLRGLGLLDFEADLRQTTEAVREQSAALEETLSELERAAEVRLALGGTGRAEIGGIGGDVGAGLTRGQAEAIQRIAGEFRAGGITDVEAIRELRAVADEAGESVAALAESFAAAATRSAEAVETLGRQTEAMSRVAEGAEDLGGRTIEQFQGLQRARDEDLEGWRAWYHELVGGSIIPDMVTESESWFGRLGQSMTATATDSAEAVGDAFRGLTRHVGRELAELVTTSKIELNDLLSFVDSIATQILGRLIEGGLNAGINALFAPGAASPATGPGGLAVGGGATSQLHAGGVVGRDGIARLVDPAVFAGAARMHSGGMVGLRPGEVPIIAQRGETVLPRGVAAGGAMVVNVINQSSGVKIERSAERRRADGGRELDLVVKDMVDRNLARGDHDRVLDARFGVQPRAARR